ncbi:uncharacterized protein [Dysidea avara]|uniref:uncharacterized protein isoform X2 n=1 Tax=Dysidea avara TaxID=196820 RepID=UPI0033234A60
MPKKLEEDFLLAAATNDVARLKKLLRQGGIDVNYMDEKGKTALHLGCLQGHVGVVGMLCNVGVDTEVQDKECGFYPIHTVCSTGNTDILKELIQADTEVNVLTRNLETPLHVAAMEGHTGAVDILIEDKRALVDCQNVLGYTPLHLAARHGHLECTVQLLKVTNPSTQTNYGDTPLHWACQAGHLSVAKVILGTMRDQLAKENALQVTNKNGRSPRDVAEIWRQLEILAWIDSVLTGSDTEIPIVYAKEDCEALTDGHLSFSEGDLISVISKPFTDWWVGRKKGGSMAQGLFSTQMVDQRPFAQMDLDAKSILLEEFRKSHTLFAGVLSKIKQHLSKEKWITLWHVTDKLNLQRRQDMLAEQMTSSDHHLLHPLLFSILQNEVAECGTHVSPLSSHWEKMSAGSGRLKAFIIRMAIKLSASLIATKVVVSCVSKDDAFCCGFCCLLGKLYETPGAALLTSRTFTSDLQKEKVVINMYFVNRKNLCYLLQYQELNKAIPNSLDELEVVVHNTTQHVMETYEKHIRYLSLKGAQTLADCAVLQIMESINLDGLSVGPYTTLHKQLARCIVFGRRKTSVAKLLKSTTPEFADTQYMKQFGITSHWSVHGILRMTGIRSKNGKYYCGLHSQPDRYGYRNSSRSEAVELCMAIAGEQKLIGPHHKLIIQLNDDGDK